MLPFSCFRFLFFSLKRNTLLALHYFILQESLEEKRFIPTHSHFCFNLGFPGGGGGKGLPVNAGEETQVQSLGQEDPLEEGMATDSSILAWRIPRTEEPGRLWSIGLQRVRHD